MGNENGWPPKPSQLVQLKQIKTAFAKTASTGSCNQYLYSKYYLEANEHVVSIGRKGSVHLDKITHF